MDEKEIARIARRLSRREHQIPKEKRMADKKRYCRKQKHRQSFLTAEA